jgi:hypothetical protein
MAGYIGTKAVALSTTTGNILGDMTVGGTTDLATLEFNSLSGTGAVTITDILDEDNLASNSATKLATQQSIKAYVDSQVDTVDTLAEILAVGNRTSGAGKIEFRDAAIYLNSSEDGQLDIVADIEIQIAATTVDLNGNLDVSGTGLVTGVLTTTAATVFNGGFAANSPSTISTANNSAQLTLISTDADANVGPDLTLFRNSGSPADNDAIGRINFQAQNDRSGGSTLNYAFIESYILDATDGSEDAELTFKVSTAGAAANRLKFNATEAVFNDGSIDVDFRVESDINTHALFVDGATDNVMLGTSSAGYPAYADNLTVADSAHAGITIRSGTTSTGNIYFSDTTGNSGGTYVGNISYNHNNNSMSFGVNGSSSFNIVSTGAATLPNGLTLTDGNLVVANGHGIDFSATGDGAGTDSSELLNDYEEGTWGPTLPQGGSVGTVHSAIYTKIGNSVTVRLFLNFTATNNTTLFQIGGLPYAVSSSHYGGGNIGYTPGVDTSEWSGPLTTSSHIYFYNANATNNLITNNVWGGVERSIILEVFYQTG